MPKPTEAAGAVTRHLAALTDADFMLLDVGASGGIHPMWSAIGSRLKAFGFDPNRIACDELNARAPKGVHYIPARILAPLLSEPHYDHLSTIPLGRLQIDAAIVAQGKPMEKVYTPAGVNFVAGHVAQMPKVARTQPRSFNVGGKARHDTAFTLDEFVERHQIASVDFIKIDTDGFDFGVVRGAEDVLFDASVLGAQIEVQFPGESHPLANPFRSRQGAQLAVPVRPLRAARLRCGIAR